MLAECSIVLSVQLFVIEYQDAVRLDVIALGIELALIDNVVVIMLLPFVHCFQFVQLLVVVVVLLECVLVVDRILHCLQRVVQVLQQSMDLFEFVVLLGYTEQNRFDQSIQHLGRFRQNTILDVS